MHVNSVMVLCAGALLAAGVSGCGDDGRNREAKRQALLDRVGPFIYNTDGCEMFYYPSNQPITTAAFKALRLDYAKNTAIRTVSYCPLSSGFGYFVVPDVGEYNTGSYPSDSDIHGVYPKGAKNIGHYNAARAFERKLGTDAIQMAIDWCRENGCVSFVSLRFNDTHDNNPTYGYAFFPPFKTEHPECLMGTKDKHPKVCAWTAVDFGQPLVRERMRAFVRQFFEKYDMDGLEIDFFRHAQIFKSVADGGTASEEELRLMTEIMAYVRKQADLAGRRRGKPVLISIRTPDSVGYCRAIGLDLEAWFARKLVDIWTSTGYFQHEQWTTTVAFAKKYGVRCYASMDESRIPGYAKRNNYPIIPGRESVPNYRARFAAAFAAGCDGLNLFNLEYGRLTELTRDDPRALDGKEKLYFATERGSGGYRPYSWLVDGDRFNNMPKVDPAYAVSIGPGKPYAFDLMLGEDFAAAEKRGLEPRVTVLALVDEKASVTVTLDGRRLVATGEEKGAVAFDVDPKLIRRGLNEFAVASAKKNVLHDFAVHVTYAPRTDRRCAVEHIALQVPDVKGLVDWWTANLGFSVTLQRPDGSAFIVDGSGRIAFEVYGPEAGKHAPDYWKMPYAQFHVGFKTSDLAADIRALTAKGAKVDIEEHVPGLDAAILRDPWGVPIQFVSRAKQIVRQ